jgi:hypothetical protein
MKLLSSEARKATTFATSSSVPVRARERREGGEQDLFRSRLDQIIDMNHALVKLARTIDWREQP